MTTSISSFAEYESSLGGQHQCCLIPSLEDISSAGPEGKIINTLIQDSNSSVFAISFKGIFTKLGLDRSIALINKSSNVQMVVLKLRDVEVIFTKRAWELVGGFATDLSGKELVEDFYQRAKIIRLLTIIEIHSGIEMRQQVNAKDYLRNSTQQESTIYEKFDFECSGISFSCKHSLHRDLPNVHVLERDDAALQVKINEALTQLNNNNCLEAIRLIKEVTLLRPDLPDLFWIQAIAESKLGLNEDALRSLVSLIEHNPQHVEGRKALTDLRRSLNLV